MENTRFLISLYSDNFRGYTRENGSFFSGGELQIYSKVKQIRVRNNV
jgi:hypothetical protein